jgi:hypothetical protein
MPASQPASLMAASSDMQLVHEAIAKRNEQLALAESARVRSDQALASYKAHLAAAGMIELLIDDSCSSIHVTNDDGEPVPFFEPPSKALGATAKASAKPPVTVTFS